MRGDELRITHHEAFATEALGHNLAGFAVRALDDGRWAPPAAVAEDVRTHHAERSLVTGLLRLELAACAAVLTDVCGVPPIVLKGPAVAARLYPEDPELRPYVDLDVLVPRERLRAAADALNAARGFAFSGGERFFAGDGEPWPGFAEAFGHELAVSRTAAGRTLLVELHWRMSDDPGGAHLDHRTLAPTAAALPGLADGVLAPDAVDQLLLVAVHLMHHARPLVLWCLDVARARDALDEAGWRLAFVRARERGLSWPLHAALDQAAATLRGPDRPRPEPRPSRAHVSPLRVTRALPEGIGVHAGRLAAMPWRSRATYVRRAAQASWLRAASRTSRSRPSA